MSLLVGLILTALIGPVGTESRGVAVFTHRDMAPLIERTFENTKVDIVDLVLSVFLYRPKATKRPIEI